MSTTLPEYNGWTNYMTWAVHLWITCDDRQGDCLHCSEKAPGNCIIFDQGLMEYSCLKHHFSPTRPAPIEIVRSRLDRDPGARQQLKEEG